MKRDPNNRSSEPSNFLLIPPAAVFLSLGMVLPEYLVVLTLGALLSMMVLAIVQTINRRDDPPATRAQPAPAWPPRLSSRDS